MTKKFEIDLTPQNEEWVKLIPNTEQNQNLIFNKLIEMAINNGLLLDVISQSLTLSDLTKFKSAYSKMQSKRAEYMDGLDIGSMYVEKKRVISIPTTVEENNTIVRNDNLQKSENARKPEKKVSGFTESTF